MSSEKTLDQTLASVASELSKRQNEERNWESWKAQLKADGLGDPVTLRNYIQKKEKWLHIVVSQKE
jgi:hypothetical protein